MTATGKGVSSLVLFAVLLATCVHFSSAEIANGGRKEISYLWFIENYSYSWHQNREKFSSPEFTADVLEGTVWSLSLFPRGIDDENVGYQSLYLVRSRVDDGPEDFPLEYELSMLAANGSAIVSHDLEYTFQKNKGYGAGYFAQMDDVFVRRKADYLPHDTLSVLCKIWIGEGSIQQVKQIVARTRIGVEHVSFLHVVERFSRLQPYQMKAVEVKPTSRIGEDVLSSIHITDEGKIISRIVPLRNKILSRCKISLMDASGKLVHCGEEDSRFEATRKSILTMPLCLTKLDILSRRSEFLPNDALSLLWQGILTTGVEYQKIESVLYEIPYVASKHMTGGDQNEDVHNSEETSSRRSCAIDDLKTLYKNQRLTDVELRTETKSFPAHKLLLRARSPVFDAVLANESTARIEIYDLEDDTLEQLLLFLYSDRLEDLRWESVVKLYKAAAKYEVTKLRSMCVSFLAANLSPSTAAELLSLSETHNDHFLKGIAVDFILMNEEQVFRSDGWIDLMETNPQLVVQIMLLKYKREV